MTTQKSNMENTIELYKFVLDEETNSISVYSGSEFLTTIIPDKEIKSKKDFDIECSYWYFKCGR